VRTGTILLGAGVIALVLVLLPAAPASAHNRLTGSDPADGATLEQAPEQVELTFLSSLDPLNTHLTLAGPEGQPVEAAEPEFGGSRVTVALPAGPAGAYRVDYRVLSADGDWIEGSVGFTVSTGTTADPPSPDPAPAAPATTAPAVPPTESPAATVPTASDRAGGAGGWWPWLLVALAAAAAGAGFVAYRRRAAAGR
jgi:hypothetical protein